MLTRRHLLTVAATGSLLPAVLRTSRAEDAWPNRIVRLIVPYPAGGGADAIARLVGGKLAELWGQQVMIENRGGAGGNLASEMAARSAPDGYTLYLAGEFQSTNLHLYPKLAYDPVADFDPVSLVVAYPTAIVVPKDSPARTIQEFIARAKSTPGLTFASPGHGTGPHLAGELFKRVAGIELTHVPYRGAAPAMQDVIAGRVDCMFNNIAPFVPLMKEGQVRGLAVTTAKRSPAMPDLPTLQESGVGGIDVAGWYAFFVPAKTPADIIRKMHADTVRALAEPTVRKRLEELGLFVIGSNPAELASHLKAESDKWGPLIREAGIRIGD